MTLDQDFETLKLLFSRSNTLPNLRVQAMQLVRDIDSGVDSVTKLEKVIAADMALTTSILRAATRVVERRMSSEVTTIRGAMLHLGSEALRSIALSLSIQNIVMDAKAERVFDPPRFARHCLFVGMFGAFVLRRRRSSEFVEGAWTPEELFAAGVLHDLPEALLYRVAPDIYTRVWTFAYRQNLSFGAAFRGLYSHRLCELGECALDSWGLPQLFHHTIRHIDEPWMSQEHYTELCCLYYADRFADTVGYGKLLPPRTGSEEPDILAEACLPQDEAHASAEIVAKYVEEIYEDNSNAA